MFVCLSVCLWYVGGLMEIQTLAPMAMKFCMHIPYPHLSKEGFGTGLTPASSLPGPGGKTLKALKIVFKTKDVQQFAN